MSANARYAPLVPPLPPVPPAPWQRASNAVLLASIALCLSRAMMMEIAREPFVLIPGEAMPTGGAGSVVTVVLDMLCFLPALFVGLRAMVDQGFRLRWAYSAGLLLCLGLWALASVFWSADRFVAACSAGKLVSGAAMLWALVQLVRDWRSFRIVTASAVGLLAVLVTHCVIYRYYDTAQMHESWEKNRTEILSQKGWAPDSFQAKQFEKKVLSGELMGFYASPNTLAGLTVLLAMVAAGGLLQKMRDRREWQTWLMPMLVLAGAAWMIVGARSRTAAGTPVLGLILIAVGWRFGDAMQRRARVVFAAGLGLLVLFWAAIIGHGLAHGSLFHRSLTFRWQYWLASMQLWRDNLLKGVGWENFGNTYLQYRLPAAPEEIRDPHNMFVRFATELGVVGLLLALGWLGATAWELTRQTGRRAEEAQPVAGQEPLTAIAPFICVGVISLLIVVGATLDLSQDSGYVTIEAFRRGVYTLVFVVAGGWFAVEEMKRPALTNRPAPLMLLASGAGLGVFAIHNFIDFSLFETGAWYVVMLLVGAAVGIRKASGDVTADAMPSAGAGRTGLLAGAGWSAIAAASVVLIGVPVIGGEMTARAGDAAFVARQFVAADRAYHQAYAKSMWLHNADYLLRAVRCEAARQAIATLDEAIKANPRHIPSYLTRADIRLRGGAGDAELALPDMAKAVQLNPTDISLRVDLGDALARMGRPADAVIEYRKALSLNQAFPEDEVKRLSPADLDALRRKINQKATR